MRRPSLQDLLFVAILVKLVPLRRDSMVASTKPRVDLSHREEFASLTAQCDAQLAQLKQVKDPADRRRIFQTLSKLIVRMQELDPD